MILFLCVIYAVMILFQIFQILHSDILIMKRMDYIILFFIIVKYKMNIFNNHKNFNILLINNYYKMGD